MVEPIAETVLLFPVIAGSTILELAHFYLIEGIESDIEEQTSESADYDKEHKKYYLVNAIIVLVDISLEGVVDELAGEMRWKRDTARVAEFELGAFRTEAAEHLFDIFFPGSDVPSDWKENYRVASAMLYLSELRNMVLASLPDRVTNSLAKSDRVHDQDVKRLPPPPAKKAT